VEDLIHDARVISLSLHGTSTILRHTDELGFGKTSALSAA